MCIPRDKLIGSAKSKYNDLDITTGNASVRFLAEEFANMMDKQFQIKKKVADDGHVSVELSNLKVDRNDFPEDPMSANSLQN